MFTIIGYSETSEMQKITGKYYALKTVKKLYIVKEGEIPEGSSGRPWLLRSSNAVNGNTAAGGGGEDNSPYYSKAKIDAVINQF